MDKHRLQELLERHATADQIIEEIQARYENKFRELKAKQEQAEEDFLNGLGQWRNERRKLSAQIEELEDELESAQETARQQVSDDLQSELRFEVEEAVRARQQVEHDFAMALASFETERNNLKEQIAAMQGQIVDAMERANNPNRTAMAIRDQVDSRVAEIKDELQSQWNSERRRLTEEIERLKAPPAAPVEDRKGAARQALLQKLGKLPAGPGQRAAKSAEQWERELQEAKNHGQADREQFELKIRNLELALERAGSDIRAELVSEFRVQYDSRLAEATHHRQRLEQDIHRLITELEAERDRSKARIEQLELAIPEAREAARKQALAEVQGRFDSRIDEANRLRSLMERRQQHLSEDFLAEQDRAQKQIAALQARLNETKEELFRAQNSSGRSLLSE